MNYYFSQSVFSVEEKISHCTGIDVDLGTNYLIPGEVIEL